MSSQIDFTYEEVSCDRNIQNNNFSNGLQTYRFSVPFACNICPRKYAYNSSLNDSHG